MANEHPSNSESKQDDGLAAAAYIPEMVQRIVDAFDPQRIILFGSHARGDAHRWSDIDLLVIFNEPIDTRRMTVAIRRALRDIPAPKDIVATTSDTLSREGRKIGTVYRPALREGRTVYERAVRGG
jgi:uncharacterized protein